MEAHICLEKRRWKAALTLADLLVYDRCSHVLLVDEAQMLATFSGQRTAVVIWYRSL